jgi:peptidyl-prolyl cis-trans isomerase A (cyclophilin A)
MKVPILLALAGICAFAQTPPAKQPPAAKKTTSTAHPATTPKASSASSAKLANPALWTKRAPDEFKAKLTTTKGDLVIDVHREWAPLGADRFYNLVRSGFLTNVSFYRVVPGFIVQFGASPDPKVEAAWNRASIKDDPVKQSNKRGFITFAMGGPNSRTTEVFINLKDNVQLDGMGFAAFGEVTEGMDVVDKLFPGYGDMKEMGGRGPSQPRVQTEGKPYLDKEFPQLDSIKSAAITSPAGAPPPAAKKSAPTAPTKKTLPVKK